MFILISQLESILQIDNFIFHPQIVTHYKNQLILFKIIIIYNIITYWLKIFNIIYTLTLIIFVSHFQYKSHCINYIVKTIIYKIKKSTFLEKWKKLKWKKVSWYRWCVIASAFKPFFSLTFKLHCSCTCMNQNHKWNCGVVPDFVQTQKVEETCLESSQVQSRLDWR